MAEGDIGPVIDTGIFDAVQGHSPSIVQVSGNVYAIAYAGPPGGAWHGWLCTLTIGNLGNIGAVIDTLEFDGASGQSPRIIHVSGNIFAIVYWQSILDDGIVKTFTISPAGVIGAIATLTFDAVRGREPDIIHVSGDVYAVVYRGPGDDTTVCTISISNVGALGFIAAQSYPLTNWCGTPDIIHVFGDVFAIVYTNVGNGGEIVTVSITALGAIGAAFIDDRAYDAVWSNDQRIIHIAGDVYAVAYTFLQGGLNKGKIRTLTISNLGVITVLPVLSSLIFDAVRGLYPDIIHISRDVYAIAYAGADNNGFIITLHITDAGIIGAIIDTLEFDAVAISLYPELINIYRDIYAIAYFTGPGLVITVNIDTTSPPLVQTDPATEIT